MYYKILLISTMVFLHACSQIWAVDPAKNVEPTKPLKVEDLTGTYSGEFNKAKVTLHTGNEAKWRVETQTRTNLGIKSATVECALYLLDDEKSGSVEIYFGWPRGKDFEKDKSLLMGRLMRGEGNSLNLTMLPDAMKQSDNYYQLLKDFQLKPDNKGK